MTTNLKAALFLTVVLIACKKDVTNPPVPPSKMQLLTTNVWIYDSVYINWGLPDQTLSYSRTGSSNITDLSQNRIKYYTDGTFNEILPNGDLRQSPDVWSMNTDSSVLLTSGGGFTNSVKIISLTPTKFVWVDIVTNNRGVNIPKY
ncbi:MAG TPA: hypothetical protein VFI29_12020 [Hanamia sp.]|nr:hypothetical protein [Hanamia sp.]